MNLSILIILASNNFYSIDSKQSCPYGQCNQGYNVIKEKNINQVYNLIKGKNDIKEYKHIVLKNGMKVLIISDPNATNGIIQAQINIGYGYDPIEYQGMSNLFKELLISGVDSSGNTLRNFLLQHQIDLFPTSNFDLTEFQLTLKNHLLLEGLKEFSNMFTKLTFNETSINKGVELLDTDAKFLLESIDERFLIINSFLSDKGHPFNKFGAGNKKSLLKKNLYKEVENFYKFYGSEKVSLTIFCNQPLELITDEVVKLFSRANKSEDQCLEIKKEMLKPFKSKDKMKKLIRIKSVDNVQQLNLYFQLKLKSSYLKTKPVTYWTYLLNNDSEESLIYLLKKKKFITHLYVEELYFSPTGGWFSINPILTDEGRNQVETVISTILFYIKKLYESGYNNKIWQNYNSVYFIDYQFSTNKDQTEFTKKQAKTLNSLYKWKDYGNKFPYAPEDLLKISYLAEFSEKDIMDVGAQLHFDNSWIILMTNEELKNPLKEDWLETEYTEESYRESLIKLIENNPLSLMELDSLDFPKDNPFIPKDIKLLSNSNIPTCTIDSNVTSCILINDGFGQPIVSLKITLFFTEWIDGANNAFIFDYFYATIKIIIDTQYGFFAKNTHIDYSFESNRDGLNIIINGYRDSVKMFIKNIFDVIERRNEFTEKEFEAGFESNANLYKSIETSGNLNIAPFFSKYILLKNYVIDKSFLNTLDTYTYKHVHSILKQFKVKHINALIVGNFNKCYADDLISYMKILIESNEDHESMQAKPMANGIDVKLYKVLKDFGNNALVVTIKLGEYKDIFANSILHVLKSTIKTQTQYQLIVLEELGNDAEGLDFSVYPIFGFYFMVQSSKAQDAVEKGIYNLFLIIKAELEKLTEKEFQDLKVSGIESVKEQSKSLENLVKKYDDSMRFSQYDFNRDEQIIDIINKLELKQLLDFYNERFINPKTRSVYSVRYVDKAPKDQNIINIDDVEKVNDAFNNFSPKLPRKKSSFNAGNSYKEVQEDKTTDDEL